MARTGLGQQQRDCPILRELLAQLAPTLVELLVNACQQQAGDLARSRVVYDPAEKEWLKVTRLDDTASD